MNISFADLKPSERYHLMTQAIVPRPIAWVLSDNGIEDPQHAYNLAPFSYFNAICSDPALVILSVGAKPTGGMKDTRRNLLERRACVIHIARDSQAELVTASAQTLAHGDSEVDKLNLALETQDGWPLPRLQIAPLAMACSLYDYQEIGPNKQGLLFCEIHDVYVDDACLVEDEKGRAKIDAAKLRPLARLGASEYASFGDVLSHARPK